LNGGNMGNFILIVGTSLIIGILLGVILKTKLYRQVQEKNSEEKTLSSQVKERPIKEIPMEIVIKSGNYPDLPPLVFKRTEFNKNIEKQLTDMVNSAKQIIPNAAVSSYAMAQTGHLYKATATNLMKYTNGTYSSILKDLKGQKIAGHAGYLKISPVEVFAPIIVFQAMSIVTGQHYLHEISKQLETIHELLDKLLQLNLTEKVGILLNGYDILNELSSRKTYIREDLIMIHHIRVQAGGIKRQYQTMIKSLDTNNLRKTTSQLSSSKIDDLNNAFKNINQDLTQYSQILMMAERIEVTSRLLEFKIGMANALIKKDDMLLSRTKEILKDIEDSLKYKKFQEIRDKLQQMKNVIAEISEEIKKNFWAVTPSEIEENKRCLENTIQEFTEQLTEHEDAIKKFLQEFLTQINKERELYIVMDEQGNIISPVQIEN